MIRILFLALGIFLVHQSFSQQAYLHISNDLLEQEKIIENQQRVRIRTLYGETVSGVFYIVDKKNIFIKNRLIPLDKILMIKQDPLVLNIAINTILVSTAFIFVAGGLITAAYYGQSSLLYYAFPALGLGYAAVRSPNFLKAYKKSNSWKFEIAIRNGTQ